MKMYKNSNKKYNELYALPLIQKHGIKCRYYKWCGAHYINGIWTDLLKIDSVLYYVNNFLVERAVNTEY